MLWTGIPSVRYLNRSANLLSESAALHRYSLRCMSRMKLGIHRVGQDVHLLPARCIHCPPSPCGRLSRPRTTTQAPPPLRAFAGRFGHPSPEGAETRASSQVPPLLLVRCRSRLYPVWIPASGPCRLSRRLTSDFPEVPDARPSIACRRSTSLATASPTSESVRTLMTRLRTSVRFPSPWRTRWPGRFGIGSSLTPGFSGFC